MILLLKMIKIADTFAEYFSSVFVSDDNVTILSDENTNHADVLNIVDISLDDVTKSIKKLKPKIHAYNAKCMLIYSPFHYRFCFKSLSYCNGRRCRRLGGKLSHSYGQYSGCII